MQPSPQTDQRKVPQKNSKLIRPAKPNLFIKSDLGLNKKAHTQSSQVMTLRYRTSKLHSGTEIVNCWLALTDLEKKTQLVTSSQKGFKKNNDLANMKVLFVFRKLCFQSTPWQKLTFLQYLSNAQNNEEQNSFMKLYCLLHHSSRNSLN